MVGTVNLLTGRVASRFAPLLHGYADNSSTRRCIGKRHKYVDSLARLLYVRGTSEQMSESVRTRGLPYLTESEQFVAREVCIGLGPSPRATRSPNGEHGASNGSAPRLRT